MQNTVALRPQLVPLEWHEAASVVQLVAEHLAAGRLPGVPRLEWLSIDDQGALLVSAPSRGAAQEWTTGSPYAALQQLLEQLAGERGLPGALRTALESERGDGSAAAFLTAVRFFARPSNGLTHVAMRLRQREEASRLAGELNDLTRKARRPDAVPRAPQKPDPVQAPRPRAWLTRRRLALALGGCGGAALATLLFLAGTDGGEAPIRTPSLLRSGQQALVQARDAARSLLGRVNTETPPTAPVTSARSIPASRPGRRPAAPPERPSAGMSVVAQVIPVSWILAGGVAAPAPPDTGLEEIAGSEALFDAADEEVSPPELVRPRLPSPPGGVRAGAFGRLEVIVSPTGAVERVRLLATSSEGRYYDAMLLPAVKAWVFSPARLAGRPVRYRLEISLTR